MNEIIESFGIVLRAIHKYVGNDPVNACFSIIIIILAIKLVVDIFNFTEN